MIRKKYVLSLLCLTLFLTDLRAEEAPLSSPTLSWEPVFYGYNLSSQATLVVGVDSGDTTVWLQDPRLSAWPLFIGYAENAGGLDSLRLPKPDFHSEGALEIKRDLHRYGGQGNLVDFSNSAELRENLLRDGVLVIPSRRLQPYQNESSETHLIIDLLNAYRFRSQAAADLWVIPPRDPRFPHRRFQTMETFEGHRLIQMTERSAQGETRNLTLLARRDGALHELDVGEIEMSKIREMVELSPDGKQIWIGEKVWVHDVGPALDSLETLNLLTHFGGKPVRREGGAKSFQERLQDLDGIRPHVSAAEFDHLSLRSGDGVHPYRDRPFNFELYALLAKQGKIPRPLTTAALEELFGPKREARTGRWVRHQKLQVSDLGMMTYRDSPHQAPLFLGPMGSEEPVAVTKLGRRLRVIFEDGSRNDYDVQSGALLERRQSGRVGRCGGAHL